MNIRSTVGGGADLVWNVITPHLPGREEAASVFKPEIAPAACFKQLQAA